MKFCKTMSKPRLEIDPETVSVAADLRCGSGDIGAGAGVTSLTVLCPVSHQIGIYQICKSGNLAAQLTFYYLLSPIKTLHNFSFNKLCCRF